jgi:hypothetical protein
MELYSGPKMMDDEYLKSNIARSIDRDFTVNAVWRKICTEQIDISGQFGEPAMECCVEAENGVA